MAALGRYLPIHEITQRRSPDRERRLRAPNFCELSHSGRELRATGFWQAPVKLARVKPCSGLKRTVGGWLDAPPLTPVCLAARVVARFALLTPRRVPSGPAFH
jgi:hypothetical protein